MSTTVATGTTTPADVAGVLAKPTNVAIRSTGDHDVNDVPAIDILDVLERARERAALDVAQVASEWRALRRQYASRTLIDDTRAHLDAAIDSFDAATRNYQNVHSALRAAERQVP